ncbi:hypothetical protein CsSME_00025623 [Camellia sinensis var. sinensis]
MASEGFWPLDEKSLVEYIKATPSLSSKLGNELDDLQIKEVGDGNLNFVYIVSSPSGSLVAKQALPYIRCIGESWPMTKECAYFEAVTLKEHGRLCPDHVPEVYHFDRVMSLIGMRYLEPPHIILRKGLIAGIEYPLLADTHALHPLHFFIYLFIFFLLFPSFHALLFPTHSFLYLFYSLF